MFLGVRKTLLSQHLSTSILFQISFVSDQKNWKCIQVFRVWTRNKLITPSLKILKTLRIGNVVNNATAVSTSVKCFGQTFKSFFTSCIPNLQHQYSIVIQLYFFILKICAQGWFQFLSELAFQEKVNNRWFANTWVSDDY